MSDPTASNPAVTDASIGDPGIGDTSSCIDNYISTENADVFWEMCREIYDDILANLNETAEADLEPQHNHIRTKAILMQFVKDLCDTQYAEACGELGPAFMVSYLESLKQSVDRS